MILASSESPNHNKTEDHTIVDNYGPHDQNDHKSESEQIHDHTIAEESSHKGKN